MARGAPKQVSTIVGRRLAELTYGHDAGCGTETAVVIMRAGDGHFRG